MQSFARKSPGSPNCQNRYPIGFGGIQCPKLSLDDKNVLASEDQFTSLMLQRDEHMAALLLTSREWK